MKARTALKLILLISVAGVMFSGYLSYVELFVNKGLASCGASGMKAFPFLKWPACVYGLIMYSTVFLITLTGLLSKKDYY